MNGCDGFSDSICDLLHQTGAGHQEGLEALPGSSQEDQEGPTALVELSAKGCKGLTTFWLGVEPLDQPSARQPYDYPELGQAVLRFRAWQPVWLPNRLSGLFLCSKPQDAMDEKSLMQSMSRVHLTPLPLLLPLAKHTPRLGASGAALPGVAAHVAPQPPVRSVPSTKIQLSW